jgi:hypothetical protein
MELSPSADVFANVNCGGRMSLLQSGIAKIRFDFAEINAGSSHATMHRLYPRFDPST